MIFLTGKTLADAVCNEMTFQQELREDIQDNHQLDCLRDPREPDSNKLETDQEKINRLAGAWDSECAFEAEYDWHQKLRETYRMTKGLLF